MKNRTGIVTDSAYLLHVTGPGHPENPFRLKAVCRALYHASLLTKSNTLIPRKATFSDLLLCHTCEYIKQVREEISYVKKLGLADGSYTLSTGDTQICPESLDTALLAVGGVFVGLDALFQGHSQTIFCALRPPGHHACKARGMGFCLFNNVAIGARYAKKRYGIKKVLIVDWDVHHGNGTQDIVEDDPSIFYFSTHNATNYPGTGTSEERGVGAGIGTVLNCPIFPSLDAREEVLLAFKNLLVPAMRSFQPELVMISAGFDAHKDDPLGGFNLFDQDFADLTKIAKEIAHTYADGKILSVLEGGYNPQALASATVAHIQTLND